MELTEGEIKTIGEFTYRFFRFERYVVDINLYKKNNRTLITPDFEEYFHSIVAGKIFNEDIKKFHELLKPLSKRKMDKNKNLVEETDHHLPSSTLELFLRIKQVRNNLFHGSKILKDKERDFRLINEAIEFLKLIESKDDEYKKYI